MSVSRTAAVALLSSTLLSSTIAAPMPAVGSGEIEEILVVGARLPRPVQDVVGTVDVVSREDLLRQIAVQTEDVVRYTPGVSVARADTRFGATEFTIRGLSGNRVTTLVDGVPVADQFDIGAFANAGHDYLIPQAVSRLEILRGPASTLFGSDALGGVVAVVTRDPEEYLSGRPFATAGSAAYSGADDSRVLGASVAGRRGAVTGVLHGSVRDGEQRDAAGTDAEEPLDRKRMAAMAKLAYALPGGDMLRFKADVFEENVDSRPEALLGYGRQFANTTFLAGDDQRRRYAVQLEYDFAVAGRWADSGRATVFAQNTRVEQRTDERRETLAVPVAIERTFEYRVDDLGAVLDMESGFALGGFEHRLGWGASVRRSAIEEQRDGLLHDLTTGAVTNVLLGESMPVRDFPDSTVTETAGYLHDEMSRGRLTLIPGVRLEHHRLNADADALYRDDYPGVDVADVTESALAPKLGVLWRMRPGLDGFVQYARGFRAPPFQDVNIGLSFAVPFPVRAIPNPDLKAETSDGVEAGMRYRGDAFSGGVTLFGADYDDFIESKAGLGFDPASGALLFQSRNIDRARVYGAEIDVQAVLTETLHMDAAASWTRGDNRDTDEPLNTIDPPSLVARLHWQPAVIWGASVAATAVADHDRVDDSAVDLFRSDGYVVFDVMARYAPWQGVSVNAGIFNVTDQRFWRWGSVRGRPEGDPLIDLLASPGRYGAVSVQVRL